MTAPLPNQYLVIVNPRAGRPTAITDALTAGIEQRDIDAVVVQTPTVDHMRDVVGDAVARGVSGFLAVGGDGTLHHLVNALPIDVGGTRFAVSLLPAGSGSDFARTFGQRGDVDAALDRLRDGSRYPIDVGWIDGSFGRRRFVNAANAGIAAQSVVTADRLSRRIGSLRYTAAFWMTLARFPSESIEVAIDRHRFSGDALNVVVANGQFFGGGLNVAPRATLVDGRFDVLVFSGARTNAFTVMPRLALGSHLTHRAVRRFIGEAVSIDVPETWPIEADGELLGHGSVAVGVDPGAIDYVV